MNQWTGHKCCQEACNDLNALGIIQGTCYKTVAAWNKTYRQNECFPHPNPQVQCRKQPLPQLLEVYPDAKDQIISFAIKNLAKLPIKGMHHFIITKVIPRLLLLWKEDSQLMDKDVASPTTAANTTSTATSNEDSSTEDPVLHSFLKAHRLESLSLVTVWRWLKLLGFQYDTRKKSFYVDVHEREHVVASRNQFCHEYLTNFEPYCRRWVQISMEDAAAIKDSVNMELGHQFEDLTSRAFCMEFHIDTWDRYSTTEAVKRQFPTQSEPFMSIRVSSQPQTKPIMIIGQDKSVFAQFLHGSKIWVGPKGQRPLLPKSKGEGYMLSAFVSRELGFGRALTEDELMRINNESRIGKTYIDVQAANEINKTYRKPLLVESPFVKYLYIGANNDGFWNGFHMSLQFEDVVDCLMVPIRIRFPL